MSDHDHDEEEFSEDLLGDSVGYTDVDWDTLDDAETALHDEIIGMDLDEISALKLGKLTDLQRWAVAQVYAEHDDMDGFERIARELLSGDAKHPALDYGEIGTELVHDLLAEDRLDEARALLPRVNALCDDGDLTERRFTAILHVLEGREEAGLEAFQALIDDAGTDSLLLFDLAADLAHCGLFEQSAATFTEVENLALSDNDQELAAIASEHRAEVLAIQAELGDGDGEDDEDEDED